MSENIDPTVVARMNNLPELLSKPDQHHQDENIFDLINHLSDSNANSQQDNSINSSGHLSSTPTDSQSQLDNDNDNDNDQSSNVDLILDAIEPIQICKHTELETSQSSENSSSAVSIDKSSLANKSRIPTGIPRPRVHSSTQSSSTANGNEVKSSIPRMTSVAKSANQSSVPPPSTRSPLASMAPKPVPSGLKKPTQFAHTQKSPTTNKSTNLMTESTNINKARVSPRSFSRDVTSTVEEQTRKSIDLDKNAKAKRGTSLSAGISVNSLSSDSTGSKPVSKGKPKVRVAVRHKPRESKVKIFSQKVEIKNVSSKIGSLENAKHKPQGGDVVIETRELNWNARSKINSLEKASYVPNGGNVKIENHKLSWNAKAKIGSLEKAATYVPHGGNVKIESRKLDFKSKARPKTDTGLIYIEDDDDDDEEDYTSSQNVSGENLNDTQDLSS